MQLPQIKQSPFEHDVLKLMGYSSCQYGIADFWTSDGHSKGLMIHARAQTNTSVKCGLHAIVYTGIMKYLEIPKTLVLLA